ISTFRYVLPSIIAASVFFCFTVAASAQEKDRHCAILLDNTGSMRLVWGEAVALSHALVEHLSDGCKISIFDYETIGSRPKVIASIKSNLEWSNDSVKLRERIATSYIVAGQTTIRDSMLEISESFPEPRSDAENTERFLIMISDGEDRKSEIKEDTLIEKLVASNVKVYAIGLTRDLSTEESLFGRSIKKKVEESLKKITEKTGGNLVILKKDDDPILGELMKELFSRQKKPDEPKK
ncbi:MAG: VWA domain-containing protein, partial [Aridibacter famidurans]|nr:VWA domain-containing protein [Aridibacter famidurans]